MLLLEFPGNYCLVGQSFGTFWANCSKHDYFCHVWPFKQNKFRLLWASRPIFSPFGPFLITTFFWDTLYITINYEMIFRLRRRRKRVGSPGRWRRGRCQQLSGFLLRSKHFLSRCQKVQPLFVNMLESPTASSSYKRSGKSRKKKNFFQ